PRPLIGLSASHFSVPVHMRAHARSHSGAVIYTFRVSALPTYTSSHSQPTHRRSGGCQDGRKRMAHGGLHLRCAILLLHLPQQRLRPQVQQLPGCAGCNGRNLGEKHKDCHVRGVAIIRMPQAAF
ncbi:hypothetical protein Vafri_5337, partial [Volvox africanus]